MQLIMRDLLSRGDRIKKIVGESNSKINEIRCRRIFENIFHGKFPRFQTLMAYESSTGYLLELDGFCDMRKLAFEFDGIQHYEYPNPFHRTYKQLESQRWKDEMKNYKCKIFGVTLIRIQYDIQNLEEYIKN